MSFFRDIAEQMAQVVLRPWNVMTGSIRSGWRVIAGTFWPGSPAFDKSTVNYDLCRQLYRNDGADSHLGGGFCRGIIDSAVNYMGIPNVSVDSDTLTDELNNAINVHWKEDLVQMFRNAMRDSKTIVRMWQPFADNPLTTEEERMSTKLTIIEPERINIFYDPRDPDKIIQATIVYQIPWASDDMPPTPEPATGNAPKVDEHEVWEVITPERGRFYDRTDNKWLTDWEYDNPYNFVPVVEVYNEYDSSLSGGQSDLEAVYPFIKAFHEVFLQALRAHRYHSIPKVTFAIEDIYPFLQNNFPETLDADGKIVPGSSISWSGKEVIFTGVNEKVGFVEARSVLGDSNTLLEFLISVICLVAETPQVILGRSRGESVGAVEAEAAPFDKKIARKRVMFEPYIQMLCKMYLAINGNSPERAEVHWGEIQSAEMAAQAQILQQITMALEVLLQRQLISDNTARGIIKSLPLFRRMKSPEQEARDAMNNFSMEQMRQEIMQQEQAKAQQQQNGGGNPNNVPTPVGAGAAGAGGGANE